MNDVRAEGRGVDQESAPLRSAGSTARTDAPRDATRPLTSGGVWYLFEHGLSITFADYCALWRAAFRGDPITVWMARYTLLALHFAVLMSCWAGVVVGISLTWVPQ